MPELPEVETVVRQLGGVLPGLGISDVEVLHADLLHEPAISFRKGLRGSQVTSVGRRGKNILIRLSSEGILVINLGMTGQLLFFRKEAEADRVTHPAIRFPLDPSGTLLYADIRRFGTLRRYTAEEWEMESSRLGPEPLSPELTSSMLFDGLSRSRSPIRSWLLDQRKIAGIGNIYAVEALFRAGIHPQRAANSIDEAASKGLLSAIQTVLREAIRARGTTLRDYRTVEGEQGGFAPSLLAYGREDQPCTRCNTSIRRIVFGNRSAFLCPHCQPSE
jgi:formamidopyrimidine-DNA glycosylase